MPFDYQLLTKNGKFFVPWIAGTRNTKALKSTQIQSVNITQNCDEIIRMIVSEANKPKLGFYISAKLIFGLTRIYQKQVNYLYRDVMNFLIAVRTPILVPLQCSQENIIPKRGKEHTKVVTILSVNDEHVPMEVDKSPITIEEINLLAMRTEDITLYELNISDTYNEDEEIEFGNDMEFLLKALEEEKAPEIEEVAEKAPESKEMEETVVEEDIVPQNLKRKPETVINSPKLQKLAMKQSVKEAKMKISKLAVDIVEQPLMNQMAPPPVPSSRKEPIANIEKMFVKATEFKKYNITINDINLTKLDANDEQSFYEHDPLLESMKSVNCYKNLKGVDQLFEIFKSPAEREEDEASIASINLDDEIIPETEKSVSQTSILEHTDMIVEPIEEETDNNSSFVNEVHESIELIEDANVADNQKVQGEESNVGISQIDATSEEKAKLIYEKILNISCMKVNVTLEDLTDKPYTKKRIARTFMGCLHLVKMGLINLIPIKGGFYISHINLKQN